MATSVGKPGRMSVRARRDWLAALVVAVIITGEWALEYGLDQGQRITDPVSYFGDAHFSAALVSAARRGDFLPFVTKEIPSLGAPFGAQWGDFPINEDLVLYAVGLLARPLGVFGAINVSFILACVLAGVSLFFVARRLHLGRPGAVMSSLLYGLSMYAFARATHHFALLFYFFFPWLALAGLWASSRQGIPLQGRRFRVAAMATLMTAWSEIYYVYFGAQLLALSVAARLARWGRSQWKVAALLAGIAVVGLVSMNLDTLIVRMRLGPNVSAVSRVPADVERFALKPVNFFTAAGNHRYEWGRAISAQMSRQSFTSGEAPSPYMGVVGATIFVGMLGFLLVRLARGKLGLPVSLALMALWFTFFHSVGGSNSILGLMGMSAFRSVNRASIVVLTYVLLFGAWAFTRMTRRLPVPARWVIALVLGSWGAWEAMPTQGIPQAIAPMRQIADSDRTLVAAAEAALPKGAKVFCLPPVDVPEASNMGVDGYEMFRPYFFADHLVFSHGDIKGRPNGAWKFKVSQLNPSEMFAELAANGFSALYVNLRPYGGPPGLARFTAAGATVISVSPIGDSAFLQLPQR